MYNDVSLELRNKIRKELTIVDNIYMRCHSNHIGFLNFNFPEDELLYQECLIWKKLITKASEISSDCYMLERVGRYYGVRPHGIGTYHVEFEVEYYEQESWRDWFDVTGETDGSFRGIMGKVVNPRTCDKVEMIREGKLTQR